MAKKKDNVEIENGSTEITEEVVETVPVETVPEESAGQEEDQATEALDKQEEETQENKDTGSNNDADTDEYVKHVQNWRALRTAKEKAERERDEALKILQQGVPQQNKRDEEPVVGDDDLIEGKHLKYQRQYTEQRIAQLEERLVEAQIKSKYPDFDEVVTPETLGMLRDTDPELAESLAANPNIQSKAIAAYKSIKRYGLSRPQYEKSKEKVNQNVSKPRTVTSISPQQAESPLSRANAFAEGLTDSVKEQVWKEMQDIIKQS